MSTIKANSWVNLNGIKHQAVAQLQTKIINDRGAYSSPVNSQTIIEPLSITISPLYSNSKIIVQWMVNGELHQDNVFRIFRNGSLAPNGQNTEVSGRWVGYTSAFYDQNEDSTPSNWKILYIDTPNTTAPTTYQLAVGSSSSGAYTFYLNRTVASSDTGQDAYERMVSSAVAWEIMQ
jgi:hypothetical protein